MLRIQFGRSALKMWEYKCSPSESALMRAFAKKNRFFFKKRLIAILGTFIVTFKCS